MSLWLPFGGAAGDERKNNGDDEGTIGVALGVP